MMRVANTRSMGFNGTMMASVLTRASSLALIAFLGPGLTACEISSSGDDRKARLEKMEEVERLNRLDDELERAVIRDRQIFKSRYEGRVKPGVGCDVCPDICELTDLRAIGVDEYKQAYRQMVFELVGEGRHQALTGVVQYERERLLCIARREPAIRGARAQLYEDADEWPTVRFTAAVETIDEGQDTSGPERALREVGEGGDAIALAARQVVMALEQRARSRE